MLKLTHNNQPGDSYMSQSAGEETRRLIESLRRAEPQQEQTQKQGHHVKVERPKGCVIVLGGAPSIVINKGEIEAPGG